MLKNRLLAIPFVVLAIVVALVASRRQPPQPAAAAAAPSDDDSATSSAWAAPATGPTASNRFHDPPLTERERKDKEITILPKDCEEDQTRIIAIGAPNPRDPKAAKILLRCLHNGNLGWHKCIKEATTPREVASCARRLL